MRRLAWVLLVAVSAGCSPTRPLSIRELPPRGDEAPIYGQLDIGYAVAWDEVLAIVTARYGAPEATNRKIGLIRTAWIDGVSEYIVDESGSPAKVRSQVTLRIVSSGNRTNVRVTNEDRVGSAGTPVPSSGTKEIELLERILRRGAPFATCASGNDTRHSDYGDCRLDAAHAHNAHRFTGRDHACPRGQPGT